LPPLREEGCPGGLRRPGQDRRGGKIAGPRTVAQLDSALRALEVTLDGKALARLDEIFPGPGGAAPEAYAW
jgi:aryl-alcohol dehydrogenase-like predicted oxidoreductase